MLESLRAVWKWEEWWPGIGHLLILTFCDCWGWGGWESLAANLWFRFTDYPNNANTDIPSKHRFLRSSDKLSWICMSAGQKLPFSSCFALFLRKRNILRMFWMVIYKMIISVINYFNMNTPLQLLQHLLTPDIEHWLTMEVKGPIIICCHVSCNYKTWKKLIY